MMRSINRSLIKLLDVTITRCELCAASPRATKPAFRFYMEMVLYTE